ncbi:MAG: hypothetical protein JJU33_01590 [Phycisphaerales bacterium]|nr:hypothetical protein [Phycisphaerales bacterium]
MHDHEAVLRAADALLAQAEAFVRSLAPGDITRPSPELGGGTIGQHARHVIDHYNALLVGESPVDYDRRDRDTPVERDAEAAAKAIAQMRGELSGLKPETLGESVSVRVMLTGDGREAVLGSTFARELFFAGHHAVHHFAMMRAIAVGLGREVEPSFGRAPSTVNNERAAG